MAGRSPRRRTPGRPCATTSAKEVDRLNGVYLRLLDGAGVKLHMGRGRLMDRHTIEVGGETITADKILVATGGAPVVPDDSRQGIRHHLERGVPSARAAQARRDRRRRLHRRRVRRHLQRAGLRGRPRAAPRPRAARLRRGVPHRRARGAEGKRHQDAHRDADPAHRSRQTARRPFTVHTQLGGMFETDLVMYATGRAPNTNGHRPGEGGRAARQGGRHRRRRMVARPRPTTSGRWATSPTASTSRRWR